MTDLYVVEYRSDTETTTEAGPFKSRAVAIKSAKGLVRALRGNGYIHQGGDATWTQRVPVRWTVEVVTIPDDGSYDNNRLTAKTSA